MSLTALWWNRREEHKHIRFYRNDRVRQGVVYRLFGYESPNRDVMHSMIAEITRMVAEPYWVLSDMDQAAFEKKQLKETLEGAFRSFGGSVLRSAMWVTVVSKGHHRALVNFLDDYYTTGRRFRSLWNGSFRMRGFASVPEGLSDEQLLQWGNESDRVPDLIVDYENDDRIAINIWFPMKVSQEEELRVQGIVATVCEKRELDIEWYVQDENPQEFGGYFFERGTDWSL